MFGPNVNYPLKYVKLSIQKCTNSWNCLLILLSDSSWFPSKCCFFRLEFGRTTLFRLHQVDKCCWLILRSAVTVLRLCLWRVSGGVMKQVRTVLWVYCLLISLHQRQPAPTILQLVFYRVLKRRLTPEISEKLVVLKGNYIGY